jgi:signal peptidase II
MKKLPRIILVLLITLTSVGCDQATKLVAKRYLQPDALISFAGDTLRLQYAENSGAFLSLGSSLPDPWRHLVFTVLVGIFLLGLLAYTVFSREITPFAVACLSFICAGGLSNLIDRIAFDGRVVDFLNIGIGPLRTGIFNIADMAITFGALLMFVENFRRSKTSNSSKEE